MDRFHPIAPPPMPAPLAFLNNTKYPASLLFLLMTLGPIIALIPVLEGPSPSLRAALRLRSGQARAARSRAG